LAQTGALIKAIGRQPNEARSRIEQTRPETSMDLGQRRVTGEGD
jgi:hypothetical protein